MPLLDHFHPPLHPHRHWDTFHGRWAYALADALNGGLLGPGFFAEGLATLGSIEVDVATQQEQHNGIPLPPPPAPAARRPLPRGACHRRPCPPGPHPPTC